MSAETKPVDVLAVMKREFSEAACARDCSSESFSMEAEAEQALATVAELIDADREYDEAIAALKEVNRKIAELGWIEVEFDAQRNACMRLVRAATRRSDALARIGAAK